MIKPNVVHDTLGKAQLCIYLQISKFMIKPNVLHDALGKTKLCIHVFYK